MKPSEFEDLYCFFNEQITAQRDMLKEKTVLRKISGILCVLLNNKNKRLLNVL